MFNFTRDNKKHCFSRFTGSADRFPGHGSGSHRAEEKYAGNIAIAEGKVNWENSKKIARTVSSHAIIPYGLLRTGRHRHRSGSQRTCPCRPSPSRSPSKLLMRDTRSHRSRIRYTFLCLRQLPTHSLHSVYFGGRKKRVSIPTHLNQEIKGEERARFFNFGSPASFLQPEHIAHPIDTGLLAGDPAGCHDRTARKDRPVVCPVR